jgi:hypothetical protein
MSSRPPRRSSTGRALSMSAWVGVLLGVAVLLAGCDQASPLVAACNVDVTTAELIAFPIVFLLSAWFLVRPRGQPRLGRTQLFLLVPIVLLFTIASLMRMQLGVRYLLALFPLLYLFAGQAIRWFDWKHDRLRSAALVAVVAALPLGLRHHPHHIAYFNELAGGPVGGRQHLVDSNLDWGQDLRELKDVLDAEGIRDLRLAYFGMFPPQALGIEYALPPSFFPEPGWHALSVNFVQGRPHLVRDGDGELRPLGLDEFGYFRFFEPARRIGYSIDLFHLSEGDVLRFRAAALRARQ